MSKRAGKTRSPEIFQNAERRVCELGAKKLASSSSKTERSNPNRMDFDSKILKKIPPESEGSPKHGEAELLLWAKTRFDKFRELWFFWGFAGQKQTRHQWEARRSSWLTLGQ